MQTPAHIEIYTESTPNPKTLKFVLNFVLLKNAILECATAEEAKYSPLAQELLALADIESVFISNHFITLTKTDTTDKDWFELAIEIKVFLKTFFASGKQAIKDEFIALTVKKENHSTEKDEAIIEKIELLLDKYVKPAVESDGGNIAFSSYDNGIVKVLLQGSCSGCPSSTITLKNGIEALLKKMIPEVEKVEAING